MIGFYDYTVIMTYISVVSSMIGIFCAVTDHISAAVCCLAFSGLCDMFDGKIARTKKNRTEEEKCFGIQIDSLADIVCFGILPIVLGFKLGMCHIYGIAILLFYGLAGLIRLAYFNVMEEKRQNETSENRKYYQDFPSHPCLWSCRFCLWLSLLFPEYKWFVVLLHIAMLTVGLLFILDFKFRKPTNRELVIIVAVVFCGSPSCTFLQAKDGGSSIISISFPWREVVIYDPDSGQKWGILQRRIPFRTTFWKKIYGSVAGRMLIRPLVTPVVSIAMGKLLDSRLSAAAVKPFIRFNHLDMSDYEKRKYISYNDFFKRKIREGARHIDMEPGHFISPCDCRVSVYP